MTPHEADELRALAEGYIASELSPEQLELLEVRLQASEEARLFFLAYLEVHAGLAWEFRGTDVATPDLRTEVESPLAFERDEMASSWSWGNVGRWALPLAAVLVVLIAVADFWRSAHPPAAPVPSLASVKASLHGQWADGGEVTVGASLSAGLLELQSGLVEVEMKSGTVLLIEAPASLEIVDALRGRLLGGNLVVRMPKGQSGFVMELPQMRVTDLGTEFGVSVALNGESRVQVFDGKVRAESKEKGKERELAPGETLRCTTDGTLAADKFSEGRFIRRFPAHTPKNMPGGLLYSRSTLDTVRIAPARAPVVVDGDLSEWTRAGAFHSGCLPPYDTTYFLDGTMMYDAQYLYIGAHVGDPEPMRNTSPADMDFAGGSVIVRVSTDRALGWPLRGTSPNARSRDQSIPPLPDSLSERIASIIMSYDAQTGEPRIRLQYSFDLHGDQSDPAGWQGAFRKDADGRGYTLEYAIPWELLHCADDPPRAGDVLAALWMVHWSDAEGRLCRGQLVDVTHHQRSSPSGVPPFLFFQNGPSWGRAIYLPTEK